MTLQQWDAPLPPKSATEQVSDLLNVIVHKAKHGNMPLCEWMQLCGGCKQGEQCGECAAVYAVEGKVHGPDPKMPGVNRLWNRNPSRAVTYDNPEDDPMFMHRLPGGGYAVWEDK